jgi:hypothetical protein
MPFRTGPQVINLWTVNLGDHQARFPKTATKVEINFGLCKVRRDFFAKIFQKGRFQSNMFV